MEFADLRPFMFGDRVRRINWRASARRGELWVNEQHPERNVDVVLFVDSFAEVRRGSAEHARPRRARCGDARRPVHASAATESVSSRSAATCAGSSRAEGSSSSTGSSTLCSTPRSRSATRGRRSTSSRRGRCRRRRSWSRSRRCSTSARSRALLDLRARGFDLDVIELSPARVRRPGGDGVRATRVPALAAAARGAALAVPRRGRARRRVAGRRPARASDRGGDGIPAQRHALARLILAVAAVAGAAGLDRLRRRRRGAARAAAGDDRRRRRRRPRRRARAADTGR